MPAFFAPRSLPPPRFRPPSPHFRPRPRSAGATDGRGEAGHPEARNKKTAPHTTDARRALFYIEPREPPRETTRKSREDYASPPKRLRGLSGKITRVLQKDHASSPKRSREIFGKITRDFSRPLQPTENQPPKPMQDCTPQSAFQHYTQKMKRTLKRGVGQVPHAPADALFFVRLFARACQAQVAI